MSASLVSIDNVPYKGQPLLSKIPVHRELAAAALTHTHRLQAQHAQQGEVVAVVVPQVWHADVKSGASNSANTCGSKGHHGSST